VRTKPSSTAHHPGCSSKSEILRSLPHRGAAWDPVEAASPGREPLNFLRGIGLEQHAPPDGENASFPASTAAEEDEGLLHDARNLIGAVGLYCDLLAMPHVLRPEHRHYADELRLLGERSAAMIERLIERRAGGAEGTANTEGSRFSPSAEQPDPLRPFAERARGLRPAVERCAGLLGRIAEEHALEITYGEPSALPVRVPSESVERILVNLVRNATAALKGMRGTIRVGVGLLPEDKGSKLRPWPFQRVRLMVEDSGRGMDPAELEHLLRSRGPLHTCHGIGFRVVRELVEASDGELTVTSRPGYGTRVEMEWPVAQPAEGNQPLPDASGMTGERRRAPWQS
jgi:signal transduction histidine kinase